MARPSPSHSGDPALLAIGNAVRKMRAEQGLSQEALANEVGLDRSYVGGIERGEHNLTVINLLRVCKQLRVDASKLLRTAGL